MRDRTAKGGAKVPLSTRHGVLSVICLVLAFCALPTLAQTPMRLGFAADRVPIYSAQGSSAHALGLVLVAAPIEALSPGQARWRRVTVQGWTQSGAERVLQAAPGLRVPRAIMKKEAISALSLGASHEEADTGLTWTETTLTGWIDMDEAPLSHDLTMLWDRAEALFSARCTVCHAARIPHHYTANQWTSHLRIMGPRTGLPRADQELIRVFLQHHSADAKALDRAANQ